MISNNARIGDWKYYIRTYDIIGGKTKPYVSVFHEVNEQTLGVVSSHWTNLNAVVIPVQWCQCGKEIPAILRVLVMLVDSGAWNATLETSTL